MKIVLNAREMKQTDENTSSYFGVPSIVLMERAALALCSFISSECDKNSTIGILCGTGNNGGDGLALARLLFQQGRNVVYYVAGEKNKFTDNASMEYHMACQYKVPECNQWEELLKQDILVDGLFGIGLSRDIKEPYSLMIDEVNHHHFQKVIAIDIPSGISCDTGQVMGQAIRCDATVTFGFFKVGQLLYPGAQYCGRIHCKDVGITPDSFLENKMMCATLEHSDLSLLPKRSADGNKGTFGKVLVIAGSESMSGAAVLSAQAGLLSGCGMVKIYTEAVNRVICATTLPEALISTYDHKFQEEQLLQEMKWADIILIGPGMGQTSVSRQIVSCVIKNAAVPLVIDADGLNILSQNMHKLRGPHTEIVVTPHVGEMSRMRQESILFIKDHLLSVAEEFAREYNVICVLKDVRTITAVPYNRTYINTSGSDAMATSGSGDVLAGIIAGFMAQGLSGDMSSALGVYVHGLAGELAGQALSNYSVRATNILQNLTKVFRKEV